MLKLEQNVLVPNLIELYDVIAWVENGDREPENGRAKEVANLEADVDEDGLLLEESLKRTFLLLYLML